MVYQWLRANRLCLNVKKTKYMIFNRTRQNAAVELKINDTKLDQVKQFNFLGLIIDETLSWQPYIKTLSLKLSRSLGIMNRLKSFLPKSILRSIYFAIFHSYLNYQILSWGSHCSQLFPLQKKAIRIINKEHYLQHTEPLFKQSRILKLEDLYKVELSKLFYKHKLQILPKYLQEIPFKQNSNFHEYGTRRAGELRPSRPLTEYDRSTIRNSIPTVINSLSPHISSYFDSNLSLHEFTHVIKRTILLNYTDTCLDMNCFVCTRGAS